MSSTNVVNFSLRQNKSVERSIVFDGLSQLSHVLPWSEAIYIGFGSVWFADFQLAHRLLGIQELISIEEDPIVYERARFNKPYKSIRVIKGTSKEVMDDLLADSDITQRPWIVWLDYDKHLEEERVGELFELIQRLPSNSCLLATFAATSHLYGRSPETRPQRIATLFGDAVPYVPDKTIWQAKTLDSILSEAVLNRMAIAAAQSSRRARFMPAFAVPYKDSSWMVTAGGVLPAPPLFASVSELVGSENWPGMLRRRIDVPPLTAKEIWAMQSLMPSAGELTREAIRALGFDLDEEAISIFEDHYLRFPVFSQITG